MAKWSFKFIQAIGTYPFSLQKKDGFPLPLWKSKEHGMSDVMRWFIGGQQKLMPELLAHGSL